MIIPKAVDEGQTHLTWTAGPDIRSKRALTISSSISTNTGQPGRRETFPLAEAIPKVPIPRLHLRMVGGDLHPFSWGFPMAGRSPPILRSLPPKRTSTVTSTTITNSPADSR